MASSLEESLAKFMGQPTTAVVGQTAEFTPPSSVPVFAPDPELASIQAETDALKAQTASILGSTESPIAAAAPAAAPALKTPAPTGYVPLTDQNRADYKYHRDILKTHTPTTTQGQLWNNQILGQRAQYERSLGRPVDWTVPLYNPSAYPTMVTDPQYTIAKNYVAGVLTPRAYAQQIGITPQVFRAMAQPERQALRAQYQAGGIQPLT